MLGRLAPIQVDGIGIGQDQQGIGLDLLGQVGGRHVLVDDGFDTGQALAIPGHRNATTTGTDDEVTLGDQGFDGVAFDDALGQRGRHHAAEELAVCLDHPVLLGSQGAGFRFFVDGADELGRIGKRRILGIDLHLGQQRGDVAARHQVLQLLDQHVADHALGLGTQHIQGIGRDLGVGAVLQGQQADLRAVAVHQHHVVLLGDQGDGLGGGGDVLALDVSFERLSTTEQSIATQGDDDSWFFHECYSRVLVCVAPASAGATPSCQMPSRSIGQLMQRAPPRPRPSSSPGMGSTVMPALSYFSLV